MIKILTAVYASANKGEDVTQQVIQIISSGNDDILADNGSFGDPDPGSWKYFFVWYVAPPVNNGNPIGLACAEGQSIDLIPARPSPGQYSTPLQPSLAPSGLGVTVHQAVYGTPNNGLDVTAICQAIVNQGGFGVGQALNIPISNGTFGGDPDVGTQKSFAMQYSFASSGPLFVGGLEGQTLSLPGV